MGVVPLAVIGISSLSKSSSTLSGQAFNQLEGVREIKKAQIQNYFPERKNELYLLSETVETLRKEAFAKLTAVHQIRKSPIEGYFRERMGDISVPSKNDHVAKTLVEFTAAFQAEGNQVGGNARQTVESVYGP